MPFEYLVKCTCRYRSNVEERSLQKDINEWVSEFMTEHPQVQAITIMRQGKGEADTDVTFGGMYA